MTLTPVPKPPRTFKKPKFLTRRTTIKAKRATPRRMTAVKDEAFRRWIREQPCLLTNRVNARGEQHVCSGIVECSHVDKARDGGDPANILPICGSGHRTGRWSWHKMGRLSWATFWSVDPPQMAQQYWTTYQREHGNG